MDKGAYHPLNTAVGSGDPLPGSPATVSFLSRLVLGLAPALLSPPSSGGTARMVIRVLPTEVLYTNAYCTTCLRTRRFFDRPTHLLCETCSKRLDKVAPERGTRMTR
jgi:hypothetical protein